MKLHDWCAVVLVVTAVLAGPVARGQASPPAAPPPGLPGQVPPPRVGELKPLGGDRYQIGHIVLDKRARRFTVPGRVHVLGKPLEYLATTPGGMKEYETLLEADASGGEFNLACILLGLERDPNQQPYYQFSPQALSGPRVKISVAWQDKGKRRQISAAEALLGPGSGTAAESVEWVYTGSLATEDGRFAADFSGTLVGFVHDPNSIIEASTGLGIGQYGSVSGNAQLLPPTGAAIELIIEVPAQETGAGKQAP